MVANLPVIWAALLLGLVLGSSSLDASAASATPPDRMSYQGFLVDANGVALATNLPANYPVVFRIYDASSAGNILWSEQQTVTVDKGNFSVLLGEGSAVSGEANPALSSVFTGPSASDRYLGVTVTINGTSMTLAPRLRWLPSPYAFAATKALSIDAQASSRLSDNPLYLSSGTDANNGLGYFSTFAGVSLGGPALFGSSGGALGTVANGTNQTAALRWASSNVFIGGWLGVGTTNPQTPFHVQMPGQGDFAYVANSFANYLQFGNGSFSGAKDVHFTSPGAGIIYMTLKSNGYVGIGTSTPIAPLHVGTAGSLGSTLGYFLDGNGVANNGGGAYNYGGNLSAIFASRIRAGGFDATSDGRIKQIAARTTGKDSLETIRQLQITDYTYIDKPNYGSRQHRGLIAQEVEKVLPNAVNKSSDFVPDIYAPAINNQYEAAAKFLTLKLKDPHGLKTGDVVRLLMESGPVETKVAAVPSATSFVVSAEKGADKVFVFGKQVNDFRTVNYDQIFATGISAIQELDRQVQALKKSEARVAELEQKTSKLVALEGEVAELGKKASKVDALEGQVAELRKLVARLVAAAPSAPGRVADASVSETASIKP